MDNTYWTYSTIFVGNIFIKHVFEEKKIKKIIIGIQNSSKS